MFCEVYLLDTPYHIDRPFDYSCAEGLMRGSIVRVPFGRAGKTRLGVVTKVKENTDIRDSIAVKQVSSVLSSVFRINRVDALKRAFSSFGSSASRSFRTLTSSSTPRNEAIRS